MTYYDETTYFDIITYYYKTITYSIFEGIVPLILFIDRSRSTTDSRARNILAGMVP
jgi:hypothetical protein